MWLVGVACVMGWFVGIVGGIVTYLLATQLHYATQLQQPS